ncbi:MAG: 5-bromo-4-chloroindolyl phosphate hydrolysis family protein [Paracoccaceae bacterium]
MARQFGGKYSPKNDARPDTPAPRPFDGKRPVRAAFRVNLLFIVPLVLVITAFVRPPAGMALSLAGLGLMLLAAWLTREGVIAQDAYDARPVARRPALPRKMAGSVLTGAGLFAAGLGHDGGIIAPVIYGLLGMILHSAAFGFDPLRDKGITAGDTFHHDRAARAIADAEAHLAAMSTTIGRLRDRGLDSRVDRFAATARQMFRTLEQDPRDLTAARRYLGVYLQGARDATAKFANIYTQNRDTQVREDYLALLDDLEKNFAARTETFLVNDRTDLDIEIGVLRDRLAREGIHTEEQ